jgi:hypothetical protein
MRVMSKISSKIAIKATAAAFSRVFGNRIIGLMSPVNHGRVALRQPVERRDLRATAVAAEGPRRFAIFPKSAVIRYEARLGHRVGRDVVVGVSG